MPSGLSHLAVLPLLFISQIVAATTIRPTLINGTAVKAGTWKEVVYIKSSGGACSATLVGPKVLITAAHCATTGSTVTFSLDGKKYSAKMTRSNLYPSQDLDINVGIIDSEVANVHPKTIGGKATKGITITLFGYGCTDSDGNGGNDGTLRTGTSVVTGFSNFDMVSSTPGGAALCFGDSGGPAFIADNGEDSAVLLGINSKGNISDTNYNTRLDIAESQKFLTDFAQKNGVDICGINKDCKGSNPPTDPATCVLTASPQTVLVGESVTLSMTSTNATVAKIEGVTVNVPNGSRSIATSATGTFTATATVDGPGGSGQCQATYIVKDNTPPPSGRPTCILSAVPQQVKVGEAVSLELTVQGQADYASIDGVSVTIPSGKRLVTTKAIGDYSSNGFVRGSGGSSNCFADYKVVDGGTPPTTPAYSVTPALCGKNAIPQSGIQSACIGVIQKGDSSESMKIQNVVMLKNTDGSVEVLPQISSKVNSTDPATGAVEEQWTVYANKSMTSQNYQVLDTRAVTASKTSAGVYQSIEGRSTAGKYFLISTLSPGAGSF